MKALWANLRVECDNILEARELTTLPEASTVVCFLSPDEITQLDLRILDVYIKHDMTELQVQQGSFAGETIHVGSALQENLPRCC